eukprot:539372-Alexandrium_andersonii.AAC.1
MGQPTALRAAARWRARQPKRSECPHESPIQPQPASPKRQMGQASPGSPSPASFTSHRPRAATQSAASWAEAAVSGS